MAHKLCIVCNTRRAVRNNGITDMCTPCYDYAGWENTHSDDDHEGILAGYVTWGKTTHKTRKQFDAWIKACRAETKQCPVCQGNDPADHAARSGHTNTRAHSWSSHAGHNHARTPGDRAACRKSIKAGTGPLDLRVKK